MLKPVIEIMSSIQQLFDACKWDGFKRAEPVGVMIVSLPQKAF